MRIKRRYKPIKGKWSNKIFVHNFCKNILGRKIEYGNLYVVNAKDCSILMYKPPTDSEKIIAVRFNNSKVLLGNSEYFWKFISESEFINKEDITLLTLNIDNLFKKQDVTNTKVIDSLTEPCKVHDGTDANITSVLLDIEGCKWLIDYDFSDSDQALSIEEFINLQTEPSSRRSIPRNRDRFDKSIFKTEGNSISEARKGLLPQGIKSGFLFKHLLFSPSEPEDMSSKKITEEDLKILSNPPSIFNYGLGQEFSTLGSLIEHWNDSIDFRNSFPEHIVERAKKYVEAVTLYNLTIEKYPSNFSNDLGTGLTISSSRETEGGLFENEFREIYVKGMVFLERYSPSGVRLDCSIKRRMRNPILNLNEWHKITKVEIL